MIDFFRGKLDTVERVKELADEHESISITAPTLMELATGASLAESAKERNQLHAFLTSANVLPLDKHAALLAGDLNASLITGGEMIEPMDVQIGAIAASQNERLITRNAKHFDRIPGLDVEGCAA